MNGFRGDLQRLTTHAGEFGELAEQAKRIAEDLRHSVESAGDCWGHDEIGQRFAQSHQQQANETLRGLGDLTGQLKDMGAKFAETAANYRQADQAGVAELGRATRGE